MLQCRDFGRFFLKTVPGKSLTVKDVGILAKPFVRNSTEHVLASVSQKRISSVVDNGCWNNANDVGPVPKSRRILAGTVDFGEIGECCKVHDSNLLQQ